MPVLQQGRRDGSICLAKAPPGACVDSPLQPQEKLPCGSCGCQSHGATSPRTVLGQGCDRVLCQHSHSAACSLGSMQPLIHAWFFVCGETGNWGCSFFCQCAPSIYSLNTVENLEGQTSRGWKVELFRVRPWEEARFRQLLRSVWSI